MSWAAMVVFVLTSLDLLFLQPAQGLQVIDTPSERQTHYPIHNMLGERDL